MLTFYKWITSLSFHDIPKAIFKSVEWYQKEILNASEGNMQCSKHDLLV